MPVTNPLTHAHAEHHPRDAAAAARTSVPPPKPRPPAWCWLTLCLALSACGPQPPSAPSATPQPAAPSAAASEFAVSDISGEADNDRPALTVRFTRPLAEAQDYGQFLRVTDADGKAVDGSWVSDEDNLILRFPYVSAQQRFSVEVLPGLVSADGSTLSAGVRREVQSVDVPAAAGFASQGSVLPSQGTDGLPLRSVNVDSVDVEFFRVRQANLPRFLQSFQSGGQRGYWDLRRLRSWADSVYLNRFEISAPRNVSSISHLPVHQLEALAEPGLYFAVLKPTAEYSGQFQTTYYVRTDIGLHTRVHRDRLWVAARSLASGEALGGVDLQVLDQQGNEVAHASTDAEGMAEFDYRIHSTHVLLAKRNEQIAILAFNQPALDLSEFAVSGGPASDVSIYLWSGRDLYRPGEPVQVHALLRDYDGRMLPAAQPLFATLRQPDGRPYASAQLQPDAQGYYRFERAMAADVPTGRWRLDLSPDPEGERSVHSMALRIEEFLPERMKLTLDSPQTLLKTGESLDLKVSGAWLYGAPAAGNRFSAKLSYQVATDAVPALKGYRFGDPVHPPAAGSVDALDLTLDAAGELQQSLPLDPGSVSGPIRVAVIGSLYESGGRAVSRILTRTLWPAPALVGIRPLFDPEALDANQDATFEVLRVDSQGDALPVRGLVVKLIREERDYTWNYDANLGWRVNYTQRFVEQAGQTLDLPDSGPGRLAFPVTWGPYRLEITDPATGLTTRLPFTAGWSYDDDNRGLDPRPDKVKLALDKSTYRSGDRMTVTVTPPHEGPGLLLVESDHLLHSQSFDAREGLELKLIVGDDWERHDVYLTALVFRPGTARDKITPSRAVGVVHVPIDRSDRIVPVELTAPATMRPGETLKASVSAPALAGSEAYAVVSAVDQGILNITEYPLADAALHFFGQRRYAIDAYDVYGRIIEALAGERARLKFGGDAALPGLPQARRPTAKVLTVDLYRGPVRLDAQGRAEVPLDVPDFNGALRVSALVYTADRYGSASSETAVQAPLVAEVSTPRVMAPGDRAALTLELHNLSGQRQALRLNWTASAPISIDQAQQTLTLDADERRTLQFRLLAGDDAGIGRLQLAIRGEGLTLSREYELAVRAIAMPERRLEWLEPKSPSTLPLSVNVKDWLPSTVRTRVSASAQLPLPVSGLLDDLARYAYGCIEQTTSKGYAWVLRDPANSTQPASEAAQRDQNVAAALDRIGSMQLENGHYAYWPGSNGYSDPQLTPYVIEFLEDAQTAGFKVPARLLQRSLERVRDDLLSGGTVAWERAWGDSSDHAQLAFNAHAALVLARVNQAPLGTLRNLYDHHREAARGPLVLMRLAAALKLAGDQPRAEGAATLALGSVYARGEEFWGDYSSGLGDRAATLALALEQGLLPASERGRILDVAREARGKSSLSTQDQIALLKLARALGGGQAAPLRGALVLGGEAQDFSTTGWFSRDLDLAQLAQSPQLRIDSAGPAYVVLDSIGVPRHPSPTPNTGVRLSARWFRHDGSPYTGGSLKEGEGLVVHLVVDADERLADALVVDLLPGGLEIENLNLLDTRQLAQMVIDGTQLDEWRDYSANVRYQEYREDRYVAAISVDPGTPVHLYYLVRAVSPGDYAVPGAQVEDMYRPQLRTQAAPPVPRIEVVSALPAKGG
ncbi:MAG: alpha-2-macroglobulin [Lysobacterales bacterium]